MARSWRLFNDDVCVKSCANAHVDVGSCNRDPVCAWEPLSGTCNPNCGVAVPSPCNATSACRVLPAAQLCAPRCSAFNMQFASCLRAANAALPTCVWEPSTGTCETACALFDRVQCTATRRCIYRPQTGCSPRG